MIKDPMQIGSFYVFTRPLTIKEIMATGKGIPDATAKGALNFRVPGTFRGSQGTWELVVDPNKNLIYHFNFVK